MSTILLLQVIRKFLFVTTVSAVSLAEILSSELLDSKEYELPLCTPGHSLDAMERAQGPGF